MTAPMWVNGTANTQTLEEGFKEIQAKLDFVARVVGETVSMQAKAG